MTYPTKEAITSLNRVLSLPATGREQDWDVELADPARASEFITYLENQSLNGDEKRALMALILGSLDDLAHEEGIAPELWHRVRHLLQADRGLYIDIVERWKSEISADGEPDGFAISPLVDAL